MNAATIADERDVVLIGAGIMSSSYGVSLIEDADLCRQVRAETAAVLRVENIEAVDAVANA